jgi:hypothetical protein
MYHLFRENEFLGDNDEIGGLPAILSGNVENSALAHLPRNPRHLISLAFPGILIPLLSFVMVAHVGTYIIVA